MLRPVLHHMRTAQQGLGVVAVSQRYAVRARDKFSMFWDLPRGTVTGILNGMEDAARPAAAAGAVNDPDAFFEKKGESKLGFQAAKGLQVRWVEAAGRCMWSTCVNCEGACTAALAHGCSLCTSLARRWARNNGCWCSWDASHTRRGKH